MNILKYHLLFQVKGKCSNIVLDQCKKTGLVFDSVMVGMEMVNCQSVQVQVRQNTSSRLLVNT